jgi:hypothetical protein
MSRPPGHTATKHGPALDVLPDEVEHRLAEIDAERCYGHGYLLLEPSLQRKGSHQRRGRTIPLNFPDLLAHIVRSKSAAPR